MKKLLIALLLLASQAWAQNIVAVSGSSPGAGVDTVARKVLKRYDDLYGTTSTIINKTGADGKLALNYYNELPSGTPKILATSHGHIVNYEARDFERLVPLALVTSQPCIVIVRRDFPANNWNEFVDHVQKNPGKVSMGISSRAGVLPWLMPILERNKMSVNMIPQGTTDLHFTVAAGDLDSFWSNPSSLLGRGFEDRIKIIAVTDTRPVEGVDRRLLAGNNPKLGTVLPVQGFYTTDDVAPEVRKVLSERLQGILNSKWAEEQLSQGGVIRVGGSPDQLMHTAKKDWAEWQKHKQ